MKYLFSIHVLLKKSIHNEIEIKDGMGLRRQQNPCWVEASDLLSAWYFNNNTQENRLEGGF